jgi:N-glycosylase/DNA lyase
MSGNQSEVDVVILSANETAVTIAEYIDEGSLQVTVVYRSKTTQGAFNAVHSRHSEMMDVPIPSQYYGSCRRGANLVHKNDKD